MISGDIDLTENLDFRKVVRKEIPQLPANWDEEKSDKLNYELNNNTYITTTSSSSYSIRTRIDYIDDNITTYSTVSHRRYNMYYGDMDGRDYITYYDIDEINNVYNLRISMDYGDDSSWHSLNNNSKNNITLKIETKKEPEYDIFGNLIEPPEEIPSIPWKEEYKVEERIPSIAWERYGRKHYGFEDDYIPAIPWEEDDDVITTSRWFSKYDRIRDSIAWLADKSPSFINEYFKSDDEEPDLSYLTNMSWIRVSDAVID